MAVGDVFKKRRNLVQQSAASRPGAGSGMFSYNTGPGMNPYVPNSPLMTNAQPQLQNPMVPGSMFPSSGTSGSQMANDRMQAASMRGLAAQIDAIRERSQTMFPSVQGSPTFGVVNPDVESARRLAPMLAQDAARQRNTPVNGNTAYANNPMRLTPDQKLDIAGQSAARYMQGGAAADPTNIGARFAGAAGRINTEYDKVQAGQGIFNNGQFLDFTPTGNPQWGTAENMRRRTELGNAPQQATPEQRQSAQARRAGIQREFIDRTGMNYAQARRAERKDELRQRSFNKAVIRGMNPFGPEAQAMFPQQVAAAKAGGVGQPVAGQNPMGGGARTLEAQQAAATRIQERETTSPNVAGLGVEPGTGLAGLNQVLSGRLQEDPNAEFSDESLREFQAHAKDYSSLATDTNNPFDFGEGLTGQGLVGKFQADMWKELATLPDNARARAEWLARYKTEPASKAANPEFQQPSPMQVPGRPGYRGGNPIYNPMRPIRTGA